MPRGAPSCQVVLGVDVDQHAGIVDLDAERRIARDQAARAFVAAERDQLGVQLGREADRMAALAAVLRVDHRVVVERRATATSVAGCTSGMSPGRISQPAACGRARTPALIECAHADGAVPLPPTSGRTTTSRAATLLPRQVGERLGGDDDHGRWLAIAWPQGRGEHAPAVAEGLRRACATRPAKRRAAAGRENDHGRACVAMVIEDAETTRRMQVSGSVYVRPSP